MKNEEFFTSLWNYQRKYRAFLVATLFQKDFDLWPDIVKAELSPDFFPLPVTWSVFRRVMDGVLDKIKINLEQEQEREQEQTSRVGKQLIFFEP